MLIPFEFQDLGYLLVLKHKCGSIRYFIERTKIYGAKGYQIPLEGKHVFSGELLTNTEYLVVDIQFGT